MYQTPLLLGHLQRGRRRQRQATLLEQCLQQFIRHRHGRAAKVRGSDDLAVEN